jgi:fido (protein-threonine AMPylation protein)
MQATRDTFSKPRDVEGSAYYCAPGLTPEETGERIADELTRVAGILAAEAAEDHDIGPEDLGLIHRAVFEPVFGEQTLGFRVLGHPGVTYPVWEAREGESSRMLQQQGNAPKQIGRALDRAFDELHHDLAALEATSSAGGEIPVVQAALPAARIYAQIVAIHPWEDGNGRIAWLVMTHTLIRSALLAVATEPTMDARVALGAAITRRRKRDFRPLAEHLAEVIKASAK